MRIFYYKNDNVFIFDGSVLKKTDGTVVATGDDVDRYIQNNKLDSMGCGRHPNECPCGDGVCSEYVP